MWRKSINVGLLIVTILWMGFSLLGVLMAGSLGSSPGYSVERLNRTATLWVISSVLSAAVAAALAISIRKQARR